MKSFYITPSRLKGAISVPASKSHTLRALLFALMGKGKSLICNPLLSPDTEAMLSVIQQLGAYTHVSKEGIEVEGVGGELSPAQDVIDAGNSGIVLRFVGALAALLPTYTVITGDRSIRTRRPVKPLLSALEQLGGFAASSRLDGYAPIIVRGPLKAGSASFSGEDSQPVSALLIAAAFLEGVTTLSISQPGETPWVALTLDWLRRLDISVQHTQFEQYKVVGRASYAGFKTTIPADMSSAIYPIVAALITGAEIEIHSIDFSAFHADLSCIDILRRMGAKIAIDSFQQKLVVQRSPQMCGTQVDVSECIDMITILAVIACFAEGTTEILGAKNARNKESDRIHAIAKELRKMGAHIEEREDGLVVRSSLLQGARMESHADHRVALALCVAALGARGESCIDGAEWMVKSYPNFKEDMSLLGAKIR